MKTEVRSLSNHESAPSEPDRVAEFDLHGYYGRRTSGCWRNTCPEFVKVPRVEKCNRFDDLAFLHLEVPRVGVAIGLPVLRSGGSVEQDDDHVGVCEYAPHAWYERLHHPGVEGRDYIVEEFLATVIRL